MITAPFINKAVQYVFENYPTQIRIKLFELRQLIFAIASKNNKIGALEETLRWGEPSYIPQSGNGSLVRIHHSKNKPFDFAVYFHCQTNLVETFKKLYPNDFRYEGNRAIIFNCDDIINIEKLSDCIRRALTYYIR